METNRTPTPVESRMDYLSKMINHYTGLKSLYPTPRLALWEAEFNGLKKAMTA